MFNKEPFVVSHETIFLDGERYDLEGATHCVIDGQEYIWLEDQWYELNGSVLGYPLEIEDEGDENYPQYEPQQSGGWGSTIITVLIIIFVVAAGLKVMKVLDRADDAISNIEVSPTLSSEVATETTSPPSIVDLIKSPWDTRASDIVDAMDYTDPTTRDYALSLVDKKHGGEYSLAQICDMWEKIDDQWTYVNDPSESNYFSPASNTIDLGLKGDCDDFAIVMASSILAIGGTPRVVLASNTDGGGHAYAEVCIADNKDDLQKAANYICDRYHCKKIAYRYSKDNGETHYWLNLDWSSRHPGGPHYENDGTTIAVYENKCWVRLK